MKKIIHLHRNKRGFALLELILNILIYLPVFFFLLQISLIPLQQFYLTQAARSGALIYIQIRHYERHYDGKSKEIKGILDEMVPGESDKLPEGIRNNAKKITKYLIKSEFENSAENNSLPGKLFSVSNIKVEFQDTADQEITSGDNDFQKLVNTIGKSFAHLFFTERVTITVEYPFTLLKVFNLSFGLLNLKGKYVVRYNP